MAQAQQAFSHLPKEILELGEIFTEVGEEISLVGGPVRDAFLGLTPHDFDCTTSARPEKTEKLLAQWGNATWDIGREFGTIGGRRGKLVVEVTTYRTDSYEVGSRKPEVEYGDTLEGDLTRRDFTVNAMAIRLPQMALVDPHDGLGDLASGRLRTPVSALQSFDDDPLRIMRAARFSAQLGIDVDEDVMNAMESMAERLEIVSAERIRAKKIIVATGGFSCNQEMVSTYLPSQARLGPLTVNSMGEGHQLCKAIGGVYTHMDMEANRMSDLAQVTVWGYFSPQVQVTPQGRRFIKEDQSHDSPDKAVELGLGFWWTIFDDQAINSSQKWNVEMNMKSNADRLVGPCNSLDELAAAMDVPADTLKATFETYDAMVAAGEDTEFGKKLFLQSLSAPYYAMKHFPYRYKTHGGMKITTDSQLTDKDGNPIPNVYCAGSTVADSGSDLSPNAGSGLISGKAVVEALKA